MSKDAIPPPVKSRKELEAMLGIQKLVNERGTPRIWFVALIVGLTAVLVLFAVFVYWLWWVPAGFFVFMLVMWWIVLLKMRQQESKES